MNFDPNAWWPETFEKAQLERQAEEAFALEAETANFWEKSKDFMRWFNMSGFDQWREDQAQAKINRLQAREDSDEIDFESAYDTYSWDKAPSWWVVNDDLRLKDSIEEKENPEKILGWEYSALFEKFKDEWHILPQDALTLQKAEITSDNYEITVWTLDIRENTKKEVIACIAHLNNPERVREAKWELHEDFSEVFDWCFTRVDWVVNWSSPFQEEAFEKIAQHYMWWSTKTKEEREKDLDIALTMAAEDLWQRAKIWLTLENVELHKVNFDRATDPKLSRKVRFESLANLSEIINHVEWVKWKEKLALQNKIKAWKEKLAAAWKLEKIEREIISLRKNREDANKRATQKLEQEIHAELLEAWISSAEATALIWWELDMMWEAGSESTKSST